MLVNMRPLDGNLSELECAVEDMRRLGLSVCVDLDEDCWEVTDHEACWQYDSCKGNCPFLCAPLIR